MTYEYACEACGAHWEAEQSIKDAPLKQCAACGKQTAKRLVSGGTGFLLKGGGWYADGYGSKSSSSSGGAGDATAAKPSASADSSAASSPSTKTDSAAKSSAPSESSAPKADSVKAPSSPST